MPRYGVMVLGVLAALVCGRLGLWQLDRLDQRRAVNASIEAGLAAPPLSAESVWSATNETAATLGYRRVRLRGRWDLDRQILVVARSLNGVPGVHVVTPLRSPEEDGPALLVERGWAPSPDGRSVDLAALAELEDAEVSGVLMAPRGGDTTLSREWPVRLRTADPSSMAPRYPYRLAPLILRRDTAMAGMRAVPLPERTDGPHLSYAVQWFAFGVIAVVGSAVLALKKDGGGW
ncbi:MAG TPA: SURF1 family protein [Gemmatimonadales bacterium]|nr:SURF1 family protein [Gemmatimonadales bacterium]